MKQSVTKLEEGDVKIKYMKMRTKKLVKLFCCFFCWFVFLGGRVFWVFVIFKKIPCKIPTLSQLRMGELVKIWLVLFRGKSSLLPHLHTIYKAGKHSGAALAGGHWAALLLWRYTQLPQ